MYLCNQTCPITNENICCKICDNHGKCKDECDEKSPELCGVSTFVKKEKTEENPLTVFEDKSKSIISGIIDITRQKKELEDKEKEMKKQLQAAMEENGLKKYSNDDLSLTYVEATTSKRIDAVALKKEMPKIYERFSKESKRSAYVTIKVK